MGIVCSTQSDESQYNLNWEKAVRIIWAYHLSHKNLIVTVAVCNRTNRLMSKHREYVIFKDGRTVQNTDFNIGTFGHDVPDEVPTLRFWWGGCVREIIPCFEKYDAETDVRMNETWPNGTNHKLNAMIENG